MAALEAQIEEQNKNISALQKQLAEEISRGIQDSGDIDVRSYDLSLIHICKNPEK